MTRAIFLAPVLVVLAAPALAQAPAAAPADTQEEMASEEEANRVRQSLARIECEAAAVEKEADDLFEVDDAECEIGQYDIKLDGDYNIISMTRDE